MAKEKTETKVEQKMEEKKIESQEPVVEGKITEATSIAEAEKSKPKEDRAGIAYILTSRNNTFVHITDLSGNTISKTTGGMVTKHSRLKSNPTIAMFVAKKAAERAKDLGITTLYVRMRARTNEVGLGPGAHAAVKSLSKEGFNIVNILDTTRVPRGGPKKKGGKRGRRV